MRVPWEGTLKAMAFIAVLVGLYLAEEQDWRWAFVATAGAFIVQTTRLMRFQRWVSRQATELRDVLRGVK